MKIYSLIGVALILSIIGTSIFVDVNAITEINPMNSEVNNKLPQGLSPTAISITKDGRYAYLSFDLAEVIFKINLGDFTINAVADLSGYFPAECQVMVLDATESKLFAYSPPNQKLLVIDTQTMTIIHTIGNITLVDIVKSQYGHFLIAPTGGGTVYFVNTDTYEVSQITYPEAFFINIKESSSDQTKWYVLSLPPPHNTATVGIYDYAEKTWSFSVNITLHSSNEALFDFEVLPNEQKLYINTMGGWYPEYHSYGWLYSVDLVGGKGVNVIPVDGDAGCTKSSLDSKFLYVGTGWPIPNDNNILVFDTTLDSNIGKIDLGQTIYGWSYTQVNVLQLDPIQPNILYATVTDANSFLKINLDTLSLVNKIVFNAESYHPHFFVKQANQEFGYVLIRRSANAFKLNLQNKTIDGIVTFPSIRKDSFNFDVAINDVGTAFIAQGESILEVNANDMSLITRHQLPTGFGGVWSYVLSNDQKSLYSIWQNQTRGNFPNTFLAIDASNFQVKAQLKLEGGAFSDKPFELPDDSKLYAFGGMPNGAATIYAIDTKNYTVQKTITFNDSNLPGISAGPFYPVSYDPNTHSLFVGATYVVLVIDTQTDMIKKVIQLSDSAKAVDLDPSQLTVINADGLLFNPKENCLYIAHYDRSYVSIYNLTSNQFLPIAIDLEGFAPGMLFANADFSKIYCLLGRSDSISVIDTVSKTLEKVIDLHSSLYVTTRVVNVQVFAKNYQIGVSSNSSVSEVNFNLASKQISLKTMGSSFTFPFLFNFNVSFPNELLTGNIAVAVDGTPLTSIIRNSNGTHTALYFDYEFQGEKTIQITASETSVPTSTPTPSTPSPTNTQTPTTQPTQPTSQPSNPTTSPSTPKPTPQIPEFTLITAVLILFAVTISLIMVKKVCSSNEFYNMFHH
jgi:hypothetical protein